jgi:hypothetical protein
MSATPEGQQISLFQTVILSSMVRPQNQLNTLSPRGRCRISGLRQKLRWTKVRSGDLRDDNKVAIADPGGTGIYVIIPYCKVLKFSIFALYNIMVVVIWT